MKALASICALLPLAAFAQMPDFGGKAQAEKMKALAFLEGRWEGEAFVLAGGRRVPLTGYEEVQIRAGGTCAAVNAQWLMTVGDRKIPVHEPCAMIFYDAASSRYRMLAQLGNGMRNEFDVAVRERGFSWSIKSDQIGEVRYTMNLLEDGTWHEVGERKEADGTWTTTLEMKLKKVKQA